MIQRMSKLGDSGGDSGWSESETGRGDRPDHLTDALAAALDPGQPIPDAIPDSLFANPDHRPPDSAQGPPLRDVEPSDRGDDRYRQHAASLYPADRPRSLADLIGIAALAPRSTEQARGDQPRREDSIDWGELARDLKAFLGTARDTRFTRDELDTVRAAVRDTQEQLTRLEGLSDLQLAMIEDLSQQLDRSTEHLGRKDWIIMAIGAGTALIIAGAVPPAFILHVGTKFIREIAHLFD
jgi:hypothetical protein